MGLRRNKYVCVMKKEVDFSKYGLKLESGNWMYFNGTLRIEINTKSKKVHFNNVTVDVIKIIVDMAMDGCIEFIPSLEAKTHTLILTNKEYQAIMEMREKEKDINTNN